jgi:hypothetical protein
MKKILIILLFLFSINIYAQEQRKFLIDLNGEDWTYFTEEQKTFYIVGFMSAFATTENLVLDVYKSTPSLPENDKLLAFLKVIAVWSSFAEVNVATMKEAIDDFYYDNNNRYLIIDAILTQFEKDWKNTLRK